MAETRNLSIDGQRLWDSLMEMAKIGATKKGGCCRLALTDLDRQGRDLFVKWCEEAGCTIRVDKMGNIFTPALIDSQKDFARQFGGRITGL